jgi:hypothetical protein
MQLLKTIAFLLFALPIIAQERIADDNFEDSVTKILVIPFSRFEFHTEFDISEIAEVNNTSTDSVYLLYRNALMAVLLENKTKNIEFVLPSYNDEKIIKAAVKCSYASKPERHYKADLSAVDLKKFNLLLKKYDTKNVLFINWYKIEKTYQNNLNGAGKARKPFAEHYIDFNVIDNNKNYLISKGKFYFKETKPSAESINSKNLRIQDVVISFDNLPNFIQNKFYSK